MSRKKNEFLEQDSTLRLIYAFNHFVSTNEAWQDDSTVTAKNRDISKNLGYDLDDAYFVFNNRFYSINYNKKDEDTISCEVKEYDNAYEIAEELIILSFTYAISTQAIDNVSERKLSIWVKTKNPQKTKK